MSVLLIIWVCVMLGYRGLTHVLLIRFVQPSKKRLPQIQPTYPGLSILVPIRGPLKDLGGLQALLEQNYPGPVELIIAIRDLDDSAVQATRKLVAQTPSKVEVFWEVGGEPSGLNPKNANLDQAFRCARYDWIYCSDVDTRPGPSHLKEMVETSALDPMKFVTSISIHERPKNLGAAMEVFGTNLEAVGFFLFAFLNPKFGVLNGASNLFHRSLLQKIGGFAVVVNALTDDLLFGRLFVEAGAEGRLVKRFCRVTQHHQSVKGFCERYVRWLMITKYFRADIFWPAPFNWLWQWIVLYGLVTLSPGHITLGLGLLILRVVETLYVEILTETPKEDWKFSFSIVFYDLLIPYLWSSAVVRSKVTWGGNQLRVTSSGRLEKTT